MTKTKSIQEVAETMFKNMEEKERSDGSKYYCLSDREEQWQVDIIHGAHLDRMPNDDIYCRINDILGRLAELDRDADEDAARELLYEIEPDIYTSDLTKWLSADNRNVYYLEDALSCGAQDGFGALSYAQSVYIQEIGNALIDGIIGYIDSLDE